MCQALFFLMKEYFLFWGVFIDMKKYKYYLKEGLFKEINSEFKAYFLGFGLADGCVSKYSFYLSLKSDDEEILLKLKEGLGYTGPLCYKETQNQICLAIHRKDFVEDLQRWGLVQRKTFILEYPKIPDSLNKHLIRGFFDGDGCVYLNKQKKDSKAFLTCASLKFLENIKSITDELDIRSSIRKKKTENCYVLTYSGNNSSLKFLGWIYEDSSLFLKRKKEYYKDTLEWVNRNVKRQPHRRAVRQLNKRREILKIFESAVHAERELNIRYQNIRAVCNGTQKSAGGYLWEWAK